MIDDTGRIVERIVTDSVSASAGPVPPPADTCAWPASAPLPNTGRPFPPAGLPFPSTGFQCYVRQLRGSAPVMGGEITIRPPGGESSRSAVVLRFPSGVVVVERIGHEGSTRRVLLPGVSADQALEWRLKLFPDNPGESRVLRILEDGHRSGRRIHRASCGVLMGTLSGLDRQPLTKRMEPTRPSPRDTRSLRRAAHS